MLMLEFEKYLYLIWKDPKTRSNFTIGKLSHNKKYRFEYYETTKEAAEKAGWVPLDAFPESRVYESDVLFPVFSSRLPDRKRRDITKILEKYELSEFDEFELLRKSGARLPIDTYEFVDPIFPDAETIERDFYVMGIRHYAACAGNDCALLPQINVGDLLLFKEEPENEYDSFAIRVLTKDGEHLGYIPRYYSQAITERLQKGMTYSCEVLEITPANNCSECIKVRLNMPHKAQR